MSDDLTIEQATELLTDDCLVYAIESGAIESYGGKPAVAFRLYFAPVDQNAEAPSPEDVAAFHLTFVVPTEAARQIGEQFIQHSQEETK